jgi:hypothetical protein
VAIEARHGKADPQSPGKVSEQDRLQQVSDVDVVYVSQSTSLTSLTTCWWIDVRGSSSILPPALSLPCRRLRRAAIQQRNLDAGRFDWCEVRERNPMFQALLGLIFVTLPRGPASLAMILIDHAGSTVDETVSRHCKAYRALFTINEFPRCYRPSPAPRHLLCVSRWLKIDRVACCCGVCATRQDACRTGKLAMTM